MNRIGAFLAIVGVALAAGRAEAYPTKHADGDGSRTTAVHSIPLYDEVGTIIRPDDPFPHPFSSRVTCGDCHKYATIEMGWHFNASLGVTKPGRPGEPWVLADRNTGTQLPMSYREWDGVWNPKDAGLTPWDFTKAFGRHMPGGGVSEGGYLMDYGWTKRGPEKGCRFPEGFEDPKARWQISGELEINCLACHNESPTQNMSEWTFQVARENFRWANTAASGLGIVSNMAANLPGSYDVLRGPNPDNSWATPPEVEYNARDFDAKMRVFFDVTRDAPAQRCNFCHSTVPANASPEALWKTDHDVHMDRGLNCNDCHRNGIDHFIVRGYEGESDDPALASLTCAGCHSGEGVPAGWEQQGGRMTAPVPKHQGIPEIHFEKMTCTSCHSGPLPAGDKVGFLKTSRANRMGIHGAAKWDTEVPLILGPVYMRQEDEKIAPHYMMWPAFWATMSGDEVTPLTLDVMRPVVTGLRQGQKLAGLEAEWDKVQQEVGEKELPFSAQEARDAALTSLETARQARTAADAEASDRTVAALTKATTDFSQGLEGLKLLLAEAAEDAAKEAAGAAEVAEPAAEGAEGAEPAADAANSEGGAEADAAEAVEEAPPAEEVFEEVPDVEPESITLLTEAEIAAVMARLKGQGHQEPVYVAGGMLHSLSESGQLASREHKAAEPYAWPMGHDVRPATQSLGAKGCTDCHAPDSAFFFAEVDAAAPVQLAQAGSTPMYQLQGLDLTTLKSLDRSARIQMPYLIASIVVGALLVVALLHYGFLALECVFRTLVASTAKRK